jgi:alpha,alpha-trehalose phosphorylase
MQVTGDEEFERTVGLELLIETSRLWMALGHHDPSDGFRIDGVTGPDEYSAVSDNNVYTNLMAQRNLRGAVDLAERHSDRAEELGVHVHEIATWRAAADAMAIPYDEELGVHPQSEGFTRHQEWDFAHTTPGQYPLLLHFPYFQLYRKQVVKQPDLVMALVWRGDAFTAEEKARNFAYYEARTVRDSSLSACVQAVVAAEVGHVELAYDYLAEAALMDLADLEHNTRDGVHIASLAGAWVAVVVGLGGMRDHAGSLTFGPRLPEDLSRLEFRVMYRHRRLVVEIDRENAIYTLLEGEPLDLAHHGEPFTVSVDEPVTLALPELPKLEPVRQPPGREPRKRERRAG